MHKRFEDNKEFINGCGFSFQVEIEHDSENRD